MKENSYISPVVAWGEFNSDSIMPLKRCLSCVCSQCPHFDKLLYNIDGVILGFYLCDSFSVQYSLF